MKAQEIKDAELVALAALVFHETVLMAGTNELRRRQGESPAYVDGEYSDNYLQLDKELRKRQEEISNADAPKKTAIDLDAIESQAKETRRLKRREWRAEKAKAKGKTKSPAKAPRKPKGPAKKALAEPVSLATKPSRKEAAAIKRHQLARKMKEADKYCSIHKPAAAKGQNGRTYAVGDTVHVTFGPEAPCRGKVLAFNTKNQQVTIEDEDGLERIVEARFAVKVGR